MDPLLLTLIVIVVTAFVWYLLLYSKSSFPACKAASIPFENRNYISYHDLLDPKIRANPHKFNQHIYNNIISKSNDEAVRKGIIRVRGEKNTFLVCKYRTVKEILSKEKVFSSNPFADERLIAPNAMDDIPHKKVMKYLKKYYSASTVARQIPAIEAIIQQIIHNFIRRQQINKKLDHKQKTASIGLDAMDAISKLIVMRTALFMLGLPPKQYNSFKMVHTLIQFNDQMVRIIAPQGGIGYKIQFNLKQFMNVLLGLLLAFIPTMHLIWTIGVRDAWNILRPDLNVFKLPNTDVDDGVPRTQMWVFPEILYCIPRYFLYLNQMYETYGVKLKYPNNSNESNVIDGRNVLQSLYEAEQKGDMTRSEVLVTIVQLMVNMTTANAIGNMLYRVSVWKDEENECGLLLQEYLCGDDGEYDENKAQRLIEEVLRIDAALQRLPRRCRKNIEDFHGEKFPANSNLLLLVGLANCDKEVFGEKSFEFVPDRYMDGNIAKALSFGYGMHLCIGYLLVKREMNLTLKALFECNVKKVSYKSCKRMVDVDVGNYGFKKLFLEFVGI